ncbi:hypothetical protein PRUPE_1G175400 [Prunus persica]|uniref:Uncharacterized protein n=1 Tax=Prunus persica TaxID=3760 RepID=A0A251QYV8_PRUPE|nr:hypothetical protein PRUPE_1G175400 [Prunus persica]
MVGRCRHRLALFSFVETLLLLKRVRSRPKRFRFPPSSKTFTPELSWRPLNSQIFLIFLISLPPSTLALDQTSKRDSSVEIDNPTSSSHLSSLGSRSLLVQDLVVSI